MLFAAVLYTDFEPKLTINSTASKQCIAKAKVVVDGKHGRYNVASR